MNHVDSDPVRHALAVAMGSFARSLAIAVIAEGVETAGELEVLAPAGINYAQGFFLARPGPLPLPVLPALPALSAQPANPAAQATVVQT